LAACCAALVATSAIAQPQGTPLAAKAAGGAITYPERPIRLLVGYSAGGGLDAMARLLAPRLSAQLGQQVVVENRAGAAGVIAGDATARATPDGYTIMLGDSSLLIAQYLQPHLTFDPVKSFTPIASVFTLPLVIVTGNRFPARTPAEFVSALKAAPGKYSFATSGVGTVHHLAFEMLKGQTETEVMHIPYRGAAQIVPDVISGQVPIGVVSVAAAISQAKAGSLRAVAIMSPVSIAGADIAPLADALPGFDAAPRLFLIAPAATPAAIVERLSEATRTVMAAPDLAQAAAVQGAVPAFLPASAMVSEIARESAMWGKVIRDRKISAE
jgi:tripartite-type tricarboxylate transporter receptor subunit TctC